MLGLGKGATGLGFLTELESDPSLQVFPTGTIWGKIDGLNVEKIETGYVVYVDDGPATTVEGYTYGPIGLRKFSTRSTSQEANCLA